LLVNYEGVNAFVPLSQLVGVRPDREGEEGNGSLSDNVGRALRLKVIEINRRRNRVILSERAALQEWRSAQKERLIEELREGDVRSGRISSVRNFGVFVDLGGADGLAHLSELTWERDKSPSDLFKVGDEVNVYVTKVDHENKKIALSLRRANPGKWDEIVDKYKEGQVVPALITKLVTFGAFAKIEGPIEGLIHVSELVDKRITHPREVVREGDLVPLKVVRIERDRHRLGLSLRKAREEGERLGFVFSDIGEVLQVPDDLRREFEDREGPIPAAAPRTREAPSTETREPDGTMEPPSGEAMAAAAPSSEPEAPPKPPEPELPTATTVLTPEQAQALYGAAEGGDGDKDEAPESATASLEAPSDDSPAEPVNEAEVEASESAAVLPEAQTDDSIAEQEAMVEAPESVAMSTEAPSDDPTAEQPLDKPKVEEEPAPTVDENMKTESEDVAPPPELVKETPDIPQADSRQNGTEDSATAPEDIAKNESENGATTDEEAVAENAEQEEPAPL
jgi:small subunit ribosomal protein S1